MKIIAIASTLLLFTSCYLKCPTTQVGPDGLLDIVIPLNQANNDPFGIPVEMKGRSELFIALSPKDTMSFDLSGSWLFIRNHKTIKFEYTSEDMKISGQLMLPDFAEMRYKQAVSIGTFPDVEMQLTPFEVFNPYRVGKWIIEKEIGNAEVVEYRITTKGLFKGE